MTEEEKQAIKTFEFFLDDISKNGGCTIDIDFQHKKEYEAMWKIFNLIEKQQEEIRQYEKTLHDQIIKDYDIELKLKSELEKKDKIINLMSKQLTSPIHSKKWVIEYYTKEVEDK